MSAADKEEVLLDSDELEKVQEKNREVIYIYLTFLYDI